MSTIYIALQPNQLNLVRPRLLIRLFDRVGCRVRFRQRLKFKVANFIEAFFCC